MVEQWVNGAVIGLMAGIIVAMLVSIIAIEPRTHDRGLREGRCLERGGQLVDGKCAKVEVMP